MKMPDMISVIKKFDPANPLNSGKVLLGLNIFSMVTAALSNTFAIAIDKEQSAEDKQFLIPAGLLTGVANIGTYFLITDRLIKKFKDNADSFVKSLDDKELTDKAVTYAKSAIEKSEKGFLGTNLFKKSPEYIKDMKKTLFKDENLTQVTDAAKNLYKDHFKGGAGVFGALAGVAISCGILTPIIRDVSAYFVQKHMETKNPSLKNMPYKPYFDPGHLKVSHNQQYQNLQKVPITMKNYMAFTNGNIKSSNGSMTI